MSEREKRFDAACIGASSCAEKKGDADYSDNIFTEARFIRGHALPDSSVIISVVNPWDTTALLAQYRLVNAPDTTTVSGLPTLRLPLQRMVVYSGAHRGCAGIGAYALRKSAY